MSGIRDNAPKPTSDGPSNRREIVYFCEQHGVMNKATDLKDKVDEIAKKV
jgi:hypothetical protein